MINKTVLMFEKKVPEAVTEFLEEYCSEQDDQLVHLLEVKSHSIVLVSFQPGPPIALNECLRAVTTKFGYSLVAGSSDNVVSYIKLSAGRTSQLTQAGLNKVKDLF